MGAGQKDQPCDYRAGTLGQIVSAQPLGRKGDWRLMSTTWPVIHSIMPINPNKNSRRLGQGELSRLVITRGCANRIDTGTRPAGTEAVCLGPSQTSPYAPLHLAGPDLFP